MAPASPQPATLAQRFLKQIERHADDPFVQLHDAAGASRTHTYAGTGRRAFAWSEAYDSLSPASGARPRVAIILPHGIDLYAAFVGAIVGGAIPSIFAHPSPKSSDADYRRSLGELLERVRPAIVVAPMEWTDAIRSIAASIDGPLAILTPADIPVEGTLRPPRSTCEDDVAFVQYSSGTTGLKKGVAITHRAALWQVEHYGAAIALAPGDVIASWLPLYHDMGLIAAAILPFATGLSVAAMSPFDWVRRPAMLLQAISQHRATLCWLPNFAYNFLALNVRDEELAGVDLSCLRAIVNCSEPLLASSHRHFQAKFESCGLRADVFASSYAMAECTFAVTSGGFGQPIVEDIVDGAGLATGRANAVGRAHPRRTVVVSSGTPLPDTAIHIIGPDGQIVPDREVGEIAIASPSLFERYERADTPTVHEGRFRTGDLGYLAGGHLFVTGRQKDLIIVAGRNVYPQDIEAVVDETPGAIAGRAVAFGAADTTLGTDRIVVVAETQLTDDDQRAALQHAVRERVAARCDVSVGDVCLVPPRWLRKSTSGKLARGENRQRYLELLSEGVAQAIETPSTAGARVRTAGSDRWTTLAHDAVSRVLAQRAPGPQPVRADEGLVTTGRIDSLTLVTLVLELEQASGFEIPATSLDVGHFETIETIARLLEYLSGGSADHERAQEANNIIQVDDRDKACLRYLDAGGAIDTLILGSSKAKNLWPGVAARFNLRAFNFWLMSARAEDWYCALRFVLDHQKTPLRAVVLAMDVEGFSNAAGLDVRLAYSRHLTPYLTDRDRARLPTHPIPAHGAKRFDSLSVQFKLGETESWMLNGRWEAITDRLHSETAADRSPVTIVDPHDRDAQYTLRMAGFSALDPQRIDYFERLTSLCAERDIALLCCISPIHPVLDTFLTTTTTYGERLQDLRALAKTVANPLFQFFDTPVPSSFGGIDRDFLNAAHVGLSNSDLLLDFVLTRAFPDAARPNAELAPASLTS